MEQLMAEQIRLLSTTSQAKRYLYDKIDWNLRCFGILGARGTGKTTLMLQHIRDRYPETGKALYISVDSPYFQAHDLFEFAKGFHQMGGELLLVDEIHKYPDWSSHIKAAYDALPDLRIGFSGSSLLKISKQKADLSRRAVVWNLHGLSFREYLNFTLNTDYPAVSLPKILSDHVKIANPICRELKILKHFKDYLQGGYYPFFMEGGAYYLFKVREIINHILEVDLPYITRVEPRQISKIKKLLYLLSVSVPMAPNIMKLSQATEISRPTLYEYLSHLQDAKLLHLVKSQGKGYDILTKPDKIYLENSNLMFAVTGETNTGAMRELFFVNQIKNAFSTHPGMMGETVELSDKGDFIVNSAHTFEIGGKSKGFRQLNGVDNGYVVSDDMEVGFMNKIPLWLFGFLY